MTERVVLKVKMSKVQSACKFVSAHAFILSLRIDFYFYILLFFYHQLQGSRLATSESVYSLFEKFQALLTVKR